MKNEKFKFIMSVIVMFVGVFVLSYSLTIVITYLYNYKHYTQINGTVVGYSLGENNERNMMITYEVDGEEYTIYSNFANDERYDVGIQVVVRYNEKYPERYILGNEKLNFGMIIIGAVCCVFGLLGMLSVYTKKEKKNTEGET